MPELAPNYLKAGLSVSGVQIRHRRPIPQGDGHIDAADYGKVLADVSAAGPQSLVDRVPDLERVIEGMALIDPDRLSPDGALAFWLDLYNAGALALAGDAARRGEASVLRIPGAFQRSFVSVAGETLSLDAIEHAKVRRFGDPRVHGALVCGSVSCPILRSTPYSGTDLDAGLEDRMSDFLASGGFVADLEHSVARLSRIFAWFGGDFTRPRRMPTVLPASKRALLDAVARWLPHEEQTWIATAGPSVEFQSYDWGLRCSVG